MSVRQSFKAQVTMTEVRAESLFRLKRELLRMVAGMESAGKRTEPADWKFLTGKEPLLYAMVHLLFLAEIMPSTGNISYLKSAYAKYVSQHGVVGFNVENLFEEGWLVRALDEWRFNGFRSGYDKLQGLDARQMQICEFISNLPYDDEAPYCVCIDATSEEFQKLLLDLQCQANWFIEQKLLVESESKPGQYFIKCESEPWRSLGGKALGAAHEQGMALELVLRLSQALHIYAGPSDLPVGDVYEHRGLLSILEQDKTDWEQLEHILLRGVELRHRQLVPEVRQRWALPATARLRHFWLWRILYEEVCQLSHGTFQSYLCHYFLRRFPELGQNDQRQFALLLSKPLYQIMLVESKVPEALIECLELDNGRLSALLVLTEYLHDKLMENGRLAGECLAAFIWKMELSAEDFVEYLVFLHANGKRWARSHDLYRVIEQELLDSYKVTAPHVFVSDCLEACVQGVSDAQAIDANNYFCLLLELGWGVRRLPAENRSAQYERIYQGLQQWLQRNQMEDLLLSTLPTEKLDQTDWHGILSANQMHSKEFFERLKVPLSDSGIDHLRQSKIAEFLLYLGLRWLEALPAEGQQMEGFQLKFINFFFAVQDRLGIFHGDYLKILSNEHTLASVLHYYPHLTKRVQARFENKLQEAKNEDAVALLFWYPYIDSNALREVYLQLLPDALRHLQESIHFMPALVTVADNLADTALDLYDKDDNSELQRQIVTVLQQIVSLVSEKVKSSSRIANDYQQWLDSLQKQLLLLQDDWEKLTKDDFFLAQKEIIIGKIESLRKAEAILRPHVDQGKISFVFNYMITEALLVQALQEQGDEFDTELEHFHQAVYVLEINNKKIRADSRWKISYYKLLISQQQADVDLVYQTYWSLPETHRQRRECVLLMAEYLLDRNNYTQAEELVNKLKSQIGDDKEVTEFLARLYVRKSGRQVSKLPEQNVPAEKSDIENVRDALQRFRDFSTEQQAEVLQRTTAEQVAVFDAWQGASGSQVPGRREVYLLTVLLYVASWIQAYSPRLIYEKDGKETSSPEDTYNKLAQYFLDSYDWDFKSFTVRDQTQEGARSLSKSGRLTPGELDLLLYWHRNPILLIEGIKLKCSSDEIEKHLNKLPSYNIMNMRLAVMLVYVDNKDMAAFQKRYIKRLEDDMRKNQCGIREIKTDTALGWPLTGVDAPALNFIRTRHHFEQGYDRGMDMDVYHIFVLIGKGDSNINGKTSEVSHI